MTVKVIVTVIVVLTAAAGCGSAQTAERLSDSGPSGSLPAGSLPAAEIPREFLDQTPPPGAASQFETDFSRAVVSFEDIIAGGPPKDGIPAIDSPSFIDVSEADWWLEDPEAVFVVSAGGETHIHPVQILMWHEIANDVVGGVPITVTYCPLCNTGVAFEREFDGQILDFGVSGRLRFSNMIMYDRQTETWWQQASGEGIAGDYAGRRLELYPMLMLSWSDASSQYPDAKVLSRDTGYNRSYGTNPYVGYDRAARPFLYRGPAIDGDFSPMTRVVMVGRHGETDAVAYPVLREERVVALTLGGEDVVVFWQPGTASALESSAVSGGSDVGTANAFRSSLDGRSLTFEAADDRIVDTETRSTWNAAGTAVDGPLAGSSLEPVVTVQHFWFSWTAFAPGS